jgi:DNA-binding transcriptional MocR family regulator
MRLAARANECNIAMFPAGRTFPYRKDPLDRTLRIAPTFLPAEDVRVAAEAVAVCVLIAAGDAL